MHARAHVQAVTHTHALLYFDANKTLPRLQTAGFEGETQTTGRRTDDGHT